eukprot:773990-Pleurochrysis_carterae.AAC.2
MARPAEGRGVAGGAIVLNIVSISCRSTLACCSVRARTEETGAAAVGAAKGVELAGVEGVVGPVVAAAAGARGNVNVGAMGEGESIVYGVYKLKKTA